MVGQNHEDEKNIVSVNKLICKQEDGPGSHQSPTLSLTRDEILRRVGEILRGVTEGKRLLH